MAKYKIKVIQHLLKGNKIGKSGEIIDGSQFINLQASLDGGYVVEVKDEKTSKNTTEESKLEKEIKVVKKLNKEDLIAYAKTQGIEVDAELSKKELLIDIIAELEEKFSKAGE